MGGRCRRRGNATRHTDFVHGFRSIRRGAARRSSWMGVDEDHKPDPELVGEGDGDDGRGTTWRCGTRAVGNCRRMIAPGGRRALRLVPDHHHRSPCRVRRLLAPSSCSATLLDAISGLDSVLPCDINYSVFPRLLLSALSPMSSMSSSWSLAPSPRLVLCSRRQEQ